MRTRAAALVALPLAALAPSTARAQARFRAEVGAQLEPTRRWELSVSERMVLGDRVASSGRWQTLVGASYAPRRWLSFGVGYRLSVEREYGVTLLQHRALVEAAVALRWRRFRFGYRLRGQGFFQEKRNEVDFDPYLRNRVQVRWRSPVPVDVSVSAELFSDIGGTTLEALDRVRVEAGVEGRVGAFELGASYRYDTPWQGGGSPYHMGMVSVFWRWERARRPRDEARDEPRDEAPAR